MNRQPTKTAHGRTRSKAVQLGSILLIPVLAAVTAACAGSPVAAGGTPESDQLVAGAKSPTILLVHGAFADGASWNAVSEILLARKYHVVTPAIGLRGLTDDSAYVRSYLKQIDGCVLPVGHSYGAAVITNAATGAANAVGLVFVSGLEPDQGERLADVEKTSKDSVLNSNLVKLTYPEGTGTAVEYLVDPAAFPAVFAGDLPPNQAAVLAAEQRPAADAAFSEPSGVRHRSRTSTVRTPSIPRKLIRSRTRMRGSCVLGVPVQGLESRPCRQRVRAVWPWSSGANVAGLSP